MGKGAQTFYAANPVPKPSSKQSSWEAAGALFEETGEVRLDWVRERSRELLTGRYEEVLDRLRQASTRPGDACGRAARYLDRNVERMDYARYPARAGRLRSGSLEKLVAP